MSSQHKAPTTQVSPPFIHSRTPAITVSRIKTCILTWMIPVEEPRFEGTFFEPIIMVQWKKWGVSPIVVALQTQPFSTSVIMGVRGIVDLVYELAELCIHPRWWYLFCAEGSMSRWVSYKRIIPSSFSSSNIITQTFSPQTRQLEPENHHFVLLNLHELLGFHVCLRGVYVVEIT